MNKWIAEFELEDGDIMPEHMDLEYKGARIDFHCRPLEQEPTTKNNLPYCQHTDEEIAKSFIEDVEAVKEQLPCGEQMDFPNTFDEFAKHHQIVDKDEHYSNGIEYIPVFRVKQWLEHIATTKNDLRIAYISKKSVTDELKRYFHDEYYQRTSIQDCRDSFIEDVLIHLPSVTPQEPRKGHWLTHKEYCDKNNLLPSGYGSYYWCSECGCGIDSSAFHQGRYDYCPTCGAKMAEVRIGNECDDC